MGARSGRATHEEWDLNELSQSTGVPSERIQAIYQRFNQAAGSDGQLDMKEFANVYHHFPGAQNQDPQYMQQQIPRIFRTFDRDGSGTLSFDEFLSAIIMMNRTMPRSDRIDFLIRQNNAQGRQQHNGQISAQYGHQVFRRLNDYYGLPPGSEHQCWKQVDQNNRGYVTHQDLMDYIANQPAYNQRYQ
jgi:Ca2+-binding EF-hand superfamily protein